MSAQLNKQKFSFSSLMVQGTTSDAGKSTLVTGLGRVLYRAGISVVPFKPQNMALNSAVTADGGEIGRAQAVQAKACGVAPTTDMNPVLIKPASDTQAQIIIQGRVLSGMDAQHFHQYKPVARKAVMESFSRLCDQYHTVLIEGAGSPAEINLREGDIANMGFAEAADCPVVLIADIDKGGVFAHIVGTLALLSEAEQNRIIGFVINRFRGDVTLLQSGLEWLEQKTAKPVLAVLPYLHNFYLESEDAIDASQAPTAGGLNVVVPVLPRISNHTDFDALRLHPGVNLQFVDASEPPPPCDLIILPGSKNVADDIQYLQQHHWCQHLQKHLRYGGKVLGICGGLQMLGQSIRDPHAIESHQKTVEGFNLLPVTTELARDKILRQVSGALHLNSDSVSFKGYEIHHGKTRLLDGNLSTLLTLSDGSADGWLSEDNQVAGCYIHGLFDQAQACNAIVRWAGLQNDDAPELAEVQEQNINRLADTLEQHFNFAALHDALATFNTPKTTSPHVDSTQQA